MKKLVLGGAGVVAVLTLLSRLVGLLRKLAQSWALSDTALASAYDSANTIPNVLFEVAAGGALAGAVIPLLAKYSHRVAGTLVTWILAVSLPIALIVVAFAEQIASALVPESVAVTALMLRIFAAQIPLYGLSVVASGILQSHDRFVLPALSPLLSSLAVIVTLVVFKNYGSVPLLALGTTLGVMLFALPQLVYAARISPLQLGFSFPPGGAALTLRLAGAGLAALLAQQLAILAVMFTANRFADAGTYAAYNYAAAIYYVPYAVLAVPVATVTFPRLAKAQGAQRQLLVARSMRVVAALGFMAAVVLVVVAPAARTVMEMGGSIAHMDLAIRALAGAAFGQSVLYHGSRLLYAGHAGKKVVLANSLGWGAVVVGLATAPIFGITGRSDVLTLIGVSTSIGMTLAAIAVFALTARQFGAGAISGLGRTLAIQAPVLLLAGLLGSWILTILPDSWSFAFLGGALAAAIVVASGIAALYFSDREAVIGLRRG